MEKALEALRPEDVVPWIMEMRRLSQDIPGSTDPKVTAAPDRMEANVQEREGVRYTQRLLVFGMIKEQACGTNCRRVGGHQEFQETLEFI